MMRWAPICLAVGVFWVCFTVALMRAATPTPAQPQPKPFEVTKANGIMTIVQPGHRTITVRVKAITDCVVWPPNMGPNMMPHTTVDISVGAAKYRLDCVDAAHADKFVDGVFGTEPEPDE